MASSLVRSRFADRPTSRRGAWIAPGLVLIVPAIFSRVYDRIWWPAELKLRQGESGGGAL